MIKQSKDYKNKEITIEYAFRIKFSEINNLLNDIDRIRLVGICFYKQEIFLLHSNVRVVSQIDNSKKNNENKLCDMLYYINYINDCDYEKKEVIYPEKNPEYNNLIKFHLNEPSEIFVFSIYEIN